MRSDDEEEHDYEEDEEDDDAFRDATTGEGFDVFGDPEDLDGDDDDGDGDGDGDDDDDDDDEEDDDDDDDDDDDGDGEDDDDVAATDASVGGSVAVPTSSLPAVPTPTIPTPSLPTGSIPPSADAPPEAEKDTTTKVDAMAPQLARRSLFVPKATRQGISIEAIVGIPIPSPVHCIASTACLSYLLTGSQDGYVRAYDFWASVNGGQVMTAQQRAVVGLGEGVNKAGVGRGWWAVEVPEARASTPVPGAAGASAGAGGAATGTATPGGKKQEPVYSLACDPDGLWSAAGTQSGDINLYSLRHSPGTLLTSLRGHSNVVSCMQLVDDTSLLSGSWDGVVREWDLNTCQTARTYSGHGAQISAVSVRPPVVSAPAPISVNVGEDFFKKDREANEVNGTANGTKTADGDVEMKDANEKPAEAPAESANADGDDNKSNASYDPLFDDDAEGEEDVTMDPAPGLGLALPGAKPAASPALPTLSTPTPVPASQSSQTGPALPGQSSQPQSSGTPAPGLFSAASVRAAATTTTSNVKATPSLSPATYHSMSPDIILTSSMDGQITLTDRRTPSLVGWLGGSKAPPWCMSAVWQGEQVLAGRRNGTIDIWDVRKMSPNAPTLIKTLKTPAESGPISCLVAFPDGKHVASASNDNIRLWNTLEYFDEQQETKRKGVPFRIIAGHHGGTISAMNLDPTGNFLVTASGDRGWQGESTKVVLVHEVKW